MRFYKLNGVWQSWDYLHNELGYAEHETRPTVFKSCADATWGEDAGNGYYDGDVNDMINGTFWTDADPTGWFDLDGLVWNSETYPADATPSLLVKDGVASDALVITCDDGNYYLIRAIIDTTAWIPESEVEALGWRSPSFVVVDRTTGKVVSGFNQELTTYELPSVVLNSEDSYETYELPSVALPTPNVVIGVPITGPVQAFWFTDNGRDETSDKTFTVVGNPLFDDDGSVARNALYDSAVPLSFMKHDGNMFEADSDSDIVRYLPVTDRLVLSIPGDSTTRDKSAWSVQVAKLFVLSYANTQLPGVQIELPINEVGTYGTTITLPTIDGEYESGGKTWKPSAWDIGAFGSSYSLTGDVVAHLVFTEVVQYTEITLYMASEKKYVQTGVTSSFTGNVNPAYCYQLYTDEQLTIPWTGYDYSNDYKVGYISSNDGQWYHYINSVSGLPDTTVGQGQPFKTAVILLDTGHLWMSANVTVSGAYTTISKVVIRIYPKGETVFVMYPVKTSSMGLYDNKSISTGGQNMSWIRGSSTYGGVNFPAMLVNGVYKSGMIFDETLISRANVKSTGGSSTTIRANAITNSFSCNAITYAFAQPVYKAWFRSNHTELSSVTAQTNWNLFDDDGNNIMFEDDCTYTPCLVFRASGSANGNMYVDSTQTMVNNSSYLAYRHNGGSLTGIAYVLYTKKYGIDIDCNFGDAVMIPDGYIVDCVKCSKLFVKASEISSDADTHTIDFAYLGENEFCEDKHKTWFGNKVSPCIEMFAFSTPSTFGGFRVSVDSTRSGYATAVNASSFNSDGVFVRGSATISTIYSTAECAQYMATNPTMFRLYAGGTLVEYHFTIQHSVWSFQNGVFSWVGDDTDYSDLAYWYKSAPGVRVHCVKI